MPGVSVPLTELIRNMHNCKRALLLVMATACLPGLAWSQSFFQADPPVAAAFGGSLAAWQDWYFVGEPVSFRHPGRVHIYHLGEEGTWQQSATLEGALMDSGFGTALSAGGGALLVAEAGAVQSYFLEDGSWTAAAGLAGSELTAAARFGMAVATDGELAFVGAPGESGGAGAVYVFERGDAGWTLDVKLEPQNGERSFGSSLAWSQGLLLVGAPGSEAGSATLFGRDGTSGEFFVSASFAGSDVEASRSFGSAVHLYRRLAVIGAPQDRRLSGSVHVFEGAEGNWTHSGTIAPVEQEARSMFGTAVQVRGDDIWIGAPGAGGGVYRYARREEPGAWHKLQEWSPESGRTSDRLGSTVAAGANVVLAGAPGTDYGLGNVMVLQRTTDGTWQSADALASDVTLVEAISGAQIDCEDGTAASFSCSEMDLVSFLPLQEMGAARGVRLNDVWGWTDPESGREYALVGHLEGAVFVDVSDASRPIYLGQLPRTEGSPGSTWRDIKVYRDHAYIVADGAGAHGMQVFDLRQLRNLAETPVTFEATVHYDLIHSAHNIVIDEETGFAFAVGASGGGESCGGGLHMIDIREPQMPAFAGCFADPTTGRRKTGYSHDAQCVVYRGPDTEHLGKQICVGANETAISIADVTDKENPVAIGSGSYPDAGYVHQGWLSEDQRYFYQNDETDELSGKAERTRTLVWDVSDLDDPVMVKEFFGPTSATDHNLYVHGQLMYQTNNASGLRVLDISDPEDPVEVGFFDTTPYGTDEAGFNGTWSSYPYFDSGIVVVTSRREGLFIVRRRTVDT